MYVIVCNTYVCMYECMYECKYECMYVVRIRQFVGNVIMIPRY
jgi:hypothetical protein